MNGFYGRLLRIDVASRTFAIESIDSTVPEAFLGGKGLATWLLTKLNPVGVDPLAPDNCLIFATGPACQSAAWGGSRYGVFTKSPLTGFYCESYSGGRTPEAVDAAGFDAVAVQGESALPLVLEISPDGARFHPADDLWGMDTYRTEAAVKKRFPPSGKEKLGVVVIGPAGENGVRFSLIQNDLWHSAGRTGAGTVMGAKRVKAVVFRGDRRRRLADPDRVRRFSRKMSRRSKSDPGVQAYKSLGTPMMVRITNQAGCFPSRYWSRGTADHWEKISAEALHARARVIPEACAKCFMACGRKITLLRGRHRGLRIKGPEYETIYAFGGLCMVATIEEIAYLNDLCNRLGMDTITAGNLCGLAMAATEAGKIDAGFSFGDADAVAALLGRIAEKKGHGKILSQGIRHAAARWDMEDRAVHVKGLEPAGFDPRVLKGMGLGYAVADRGACHLRSTFYKPELAGMIPPEQIEDKADLFVDFEDRLSLFDTLILCRFFRDLYLWEELGEMIASVTGLPAEKDLLRKTAARVTDQVRRFNIREGLTAADDRLPQWIHRHELETGQGISEAELEALRADYYRLRGWDDAGTPPAGGASCVE